MTICICYALHIAKRNKIWFKECRGEMEGVTSRIGACSSIRGLCVKHWVALQARHSGQEEGCCSRLLWWLCGPVALLCGTCNAKQLSPTKATMGAYSLTVTSSV